MNIVNKLTIRHMKQNKRRTLVTIIGVIISVAMLTAVSTLSISFMALFQKQTIANEGEWHVLYKDVNKEQLEAISKDPNTKSIVISKDYGYAKLEGSQNTNKPFLFIRAYNAYGFEHIPVELRAGRLPIAANEVVLSEQIASNAKVEYKLGQTLTLNIGQRVSELQAEELQQNKPLQLEKGEVVETLKNQLPKSYTVVGFIKRPTWEPTWAPGYTVLTYVNESSITPSDTVNASVILKKVNNAIYVHAEQLAKQNKIEVTSIDYNNNLLRYYGVTNNDNLRKTLNSLSAIIFVVIIIGSVALIYNAFAISVSERSRHLGMLSSVGATKKQKRNSVFFEGAIIGLISIPIGLLSGLVGLGITFWLFNSIIQGALGVTEKLSVTITPWSMMAACALSMMTILISTYLPARRASQISAIEAIRQTKDIKLTSKHVKTSKLVRGLFGIEAEFGLKNLKRNKRRYRATVFSLVISIVLFLVVSSFTDNLKKSFELSQEGIDYDIEVSSTSRYVQTSEEVLKQAANLTDVTAFNLLKQVNVMALVDETFLADELRTTVKNEPNLLQNGKFTYYITVTALDEENLKAYASKIGADYKQLINPDKLSAILIDTVSYQDPQTRKFIETKAIHTKKGDNLELSYLDTNSEKVVGLNHVEIAALTDQTPMGIQNSSLNMIHLIVSDQTLNRLSPNKELLPKQVGLFLKSEAPMKTQQEIEKMIDSSQFNLFNLFEFRQKEEQTSMFISVFTYGFILLITAISIANIFNTISTSISLRKREFAMLKSVGMTPNGFNKMINYESIFYGLKSLLYGLPISIIATYWIHKSMMNSFDYAFVIPWKSIFIVTAAIFLIVGSAMMYASSKVKKENIIDALQQESI